MAQPNENSLSTPSGSRGGGPAARKTWQTSTDHDALRRRVLDMILQLSREVYQKNRQGPVPTAWEEALPAWANELETQLYSGAATKEEYADPDTFGDRLQTVAKRICAIRRTQQHMREFRYQSNLSAAAARNMMPGPTPGNISVSGVASGVMPTSGSAATMVPTPETVDDSWMSLMEKLNLGAKDD